ncbi:MAG: hypothetical protein JWN46_405 [Acidimicrobiales bacterium]|nr:hypothetical protein [Acidimicrobiales bacterium]
MTRHPARITRRTVLTGGVATAVLAGCGSSGGGTAATTPVGSAAGNPTDRTLIALFKQGTVLVGRPQRITFGIADGTGALITGGPSALDLELKLGGASIGRVRADRHREGLQRAYYPFEIVPAKTGFYSVSGTVSGHQVDAAFGVDAKVALPQVGQALPVFDTPTTGNHRGVDPICSRNPPCPLHDVNARDLLASHKPMALLVSTPAFCQVDICGPVLELLIAERSRYGARVGLVHAEVYRDGKAAAANPGGAPVAPALEALGLDFEPCLFIVGADGKVRMRLDNIFDAVELRQALEAATA